MSTYYDQQQQSVEKPGTEPVTWRPSAYGLLENERGEWLMVEPVWTKRLDFPGGGVHIDEKICDGLAREFYEETGYRVAVESQPLFIGENNFCYDTGGPFFHAIIFVFRVSLVTHDRDANVVNSFEDGDEIADMKWVHPDTMTQENVQLPVWKYLEFRRNQTV